MARVKERKKDGRNYDKEANSNPQKVISKVINEAIHSR